METSTTADAGEADPGEGCNLEQKRIKMNGKWGQSSEARKLKSRHRATWGEEPLEMWVNETEVQSVNT